MPRTKAYEPELVVPESGQPCYISDDGTGIKIAWDQCHAWSGGCGKPLLQCNCKGGPVEPYYITRWRAEAEGKTWERPKGGVTSVGNAVGTSVRKALGRDEAKPVAPPPLSMSSFIDAEVIAKVKAAKESQHVDKDE